MEIYKIRNNTQDKIELKELGLIIPSYEIVDIDYTKFYSSIELYNFLSANTFSRIYNNSSVSFNEAYINYDTCEFIKTNNILWNSGINFQYYDKSIVIGNNILKDTGNTLEVNGNVNISGVNFLYNDSYVCTREESPLANRISRWNNTSKRYESTTFGINGTNNVLRTYTLNYETYLTDGNHIPNKKYVDDQDISGITAFNWGNHAIAGYATTNSLNFLSKTGDTVNGNFNIVNNLNVSGQSNFNNIIYLLKGEKRKINKVASNYNITINDNIIICSNSGVSVTLPQCSTAIENVFYIVNGSNNYITILGYNNETIIGDLNLILYKKYDAVTLITDGIEWFLL